MTKTIKYKLKYNRTRRQAYQNCGHCILDKSLWTIILFKYYKHFFFLVHLTGLYSLLGMGVAAEIRLIGGLVWDWSFEKNSV